MNEAAQRVVAKLVERAKEGDRRYGPRWDGWDSTRMLVELQEELMD
ncbi:unnamed protein product, partial [marine sediment metagenome]